MTVAAAPRIAPRIDGYGYNGRGSMAKQRWLSRDAMERRWLNRDMHERLWRDGGYGFDGYERGDGNHYSDYGDYDYEYPEMMDYDDAYEYEPDHRRGTFRQRWGERRWMPRDGWDRRRQSQGARRSRDDGYGYDGYDGYERGYERGYRHSDYGDRIGRYADYDGAYDDDDYPEAGYSEWMDYDDPMYERRGGSRQRWWSPRRAVGWMGASRARGSRGYDRAY